MTMFGSPWFGSAGAAFTIDQSCRFTTAATSYLTWAPGDAPDSQRKFTFSYWMKRGKISTPGEQIHTESTGAAGGNAGFGIYIRTDNKPEIYQWPVRLLTTTATHTTTNDWVHVVEVIDTTQATDTNRIKLYIDGALITSFAYATYPAQNADLGITSSGVVNRIGATSAGAYPIDMYLAEFHYLDGIAAAVGDFGQTIDGVYLPKEYTGSYGGHGYYLDFSDSSDLGADQSGNSNDFTSSGLTSTDQLLDSPTKNYATFDPNNSDACTLSEVTLKTNAPAYWSSVASTQTVSGSGKYYVETLVGNRYGTYAGGGFVPDSVSTANMAAAVYYGAADSAYTPNDGFGVEFNGGNVGYYAASGTTDFGPITEPDGTTIYSTNELYILYALDLDNEFFWVGTAFTSDNTVTWFGPAGSGADPTDGGTTGLDISGYITAQSDPDLLFVHAPNNGHGDPYCTVNFGQSTYKFTPPTDYIGIYDEKV